MRRTDALDIEVVLGQEEVTGSLGLSSVSNELRNQSSVQACKTMGVEVTHDGDDMRRVGNNGDADRAEIRLDGRDVDLLALAVDHVVLLVLDSSTGSGHSSRRKGGGLEGTT